ncbi:MAG TPA: NAD(P)-binding protein [Acidobacteriaceae bacterium]|jgi:choline dehydrogenase-like flavoprotein
MYYVIGSGPSGVACAYALVRKGLQVTLIDAGLQLETARRQQLLDLQAIAPQEWRGPKGAFLRDGMDATSQGIPLKLAYGSDFPYRAVAGATEVALHSASSTPSYAQGGLSNVWGSAVLPYRPLDIPDWPISVDRLARHYRAVFEFMPLAACRDSLEEEFPLYSQHPEPLRMSRQASSMLSDLERHGATLRRQGVRYGCSRIAVEAKRSGHSCAHCGLCMYGCPYELIYSTSRTLAYLQGFGNFQYMPGLRATRVEENADEARVIIRSLSTGDAGVFAGERVYLACGVLSTTALLLRSLDHYDQTVQAVDSKYFLLPILRFRGTPGVRSEALHTLAQIFLEIDDPAISPHTIHLQTYTYNDLFEAALRSALGPLARVLSGETLISRLLLFQGYLHSAHSARLQMELRRKGEDDDLLHVSGEERPESQGVLRKLIWKLFALSGEISAVPLFPLLRPGAPGRGFHTGGSFPMREHPQGIETDIYGRPSGLSRIHAVDSSIFPSIPATTITLTAMANAHRIADELEQYA